MDIWIFQFVAKVWRMRKHQKAWFRDHGRYDLIQAKRYEAEVDSELSERLIVVDGEPKELNVPEDRSADLKQSSMFAGDEEE